ncbi:MAG: nucleoside 2-deoxyribosyltransferase [Chloroflexi bacterium]|nr:nucleoside 2-deoxyribosyltransferase [Chloroflexota bacterium]
MTRVFLSIKYHADHANRARIEAICAALAQNACATICIARDVEEWGRAHFDSRELMARTFAAIDASDLVVIDLTEKGVGVGIEAGYARAKQIPIIVIAQRGADISTTLHGIARNVIFYNEPGDLAHLFANIS